LTEQRNAGTQGGKGAEDFFVGAGHIPNVTPKMKLVTRPPLGIGIGGDVGATASALACYAMGVGHEYTPLTGERGVCRMLRPAVRAESGNGTRVTQGQRHRGFFVGAGHIPGGTSNMEDVTRPQFSTAKGEQ
jgi:hypothetical protein